MYNVSYNYDNTMLASLLEKLDLSSYESKILAALFEHSPSGASFIAKKCGFSRSTVYTALNALIARGFVSTTHKNEVKQFVATGAEALAESLRGARRELEGKERVLEDLMTHVRALHKDDLHIPHVMFFEGVEGLKRIYLSMIREARNAATFYILRDEFIWQDVWTFSWEKEWQDRVRRWKSEKQLATKLLVNPSPLEIKKAAFYKKREGLEFRYLPKTQMVRAFALYILGDTVAIMSMEQSNLIGIKIVNAHLAHNFEKVFEILWLQAKSPH